MAIKKCLFIFCLVLLPFDAWATTYYVKNGGSDGAAGTNDATAWATIGKVNSSVSGSGDDVYFKCDDTFNDTYLAIDWSGTGGDYATIGAYYGSGTIGVSGSKPVFDGQDTIPADEYTGMIDVTGSYVEVKNINVVDTEGNGIGVKNTTYVNVTDCDIDNTLMSGIRYKNTNYGTISGCDVENSVMCYFEGPCSSTPWPANLVLIGSTYITVTGNTVHEGGGEGIGTFTNNASYPASYNTIEYNISYANRALEIGVINSDHNTVRYNLVYGTTDTTYWRGGATSVGIYINDEVGRGGARSANNAIYCNLVANCSAGIAIGTSAEVGSSFDDSVIYNNSIVDCTDGFILWGNNSSNSNIKNNIIYGTSGVFDLYDGPSTTSGITWDYNNWSSSVSGDASGAHDVVDDPSLEKSSGWSSLTADSLDGTEFALKSGSAVIDQGTNLGATYDDALDPFSTFPDPDTLDQDDYGSWEIGAFVAITGGVSGTITTGLGGSNVSEANIVSGQDDESNALTIIVTVAGATFDATLGADNAITTAFIQGFDSAQAEAHGWDNEIKDVLTYTAVTRDSSTQATVTIPATANYDITTNETITLTIPASALSVSEPIEAEPDLTISAYQESPAVTTGIRSMVYSASGRSMVHAPTGLSIVSVGGGGGDTPPDETAPTVGSSVIATNGTTLTISFSEDVTQGSGYNDADLDLDASGAGANQTLTYVSGDGTDTHIYTIGDTIDYDETCDLDFNGDTDSLEDDAGNDLAAIVSDAVTNNSVQGAGGFAISGLSGTASIGQSFVISGASFGSGPTVLVYDNFEAGSNGNTIPIEPSSEPTIGQWDAYQLGANGPKYSTSYAVSGSNSMKVDFAPGWYCGLHSYTGGVTDVFFSYKIQLPSGNTFPGTGEDGGPNWKILWIMGDGGTTDDDCMMPQSLGTTTHIMGDCNECYLGSGRCTEYFDSSFTMGSGWYEYKGWSFASVSTTGELVFYITDIGSAAITKYSENLNCRTYNNSGDEYETMCIGCYGRQTGSGTPEAYFDDVYFATGEYCKARVELGNASTYTSCTNLSICPSTAWASGEITVNFQPGSMTGANYLFVIDSENTATAGYAITVGNSYP